MSDDGFSLKPKYVARNKTSINLVAVDGMYSPFTVRISQQDVTDTERTGVFLPLLPSSIPGEAAAQSSPNFTNNSMPDECNAPARLLNMPPVLQQLCTQFHICTSQARTSLWLPERSSVFQAVCFKT